MSASYRRGPLIGLAVAGLITVVAVFGVLAGRSLWSVNPPSRAVPATAAQRPVPPPPVEPVEQLPAAEQLPAQPVHQQAGQQPGTIRLPQGGTAELVRKEIDRSGTLPIPKGVDQATWWGAGLDAPNGATVLAGHVNWKGSTGPFQELWNAARNQPVTVVDDGGHEFRYHTTEIHTVSKNDLPAQAAALFSQGGQHRLVLVTCGGRFVGGDEGYNENRIVVADPA